MNIFADLFLLQRIDHLIRTRATGTPKALGALLDISECSVYRLMERLKDQGFPIAYDKQTRTYYYTEAVIWKVEFVVGDEKLLKIQGGEINSDFFRKLSIFDRNDNDLCNAS